MTARSRKHKPASTSPGWGILLETRQGSRAQNNRDWVIQAAEKLGTEGGGDFNPRIKPAESAGFSPGRTVLRDLLHKIRLFPQPLCQETAKLKNVPEAAGYGFGQTRLV